MATHRMELRHLMGREHTEIYQIKVFLDLAVFLDHSIFWFETRDKILEQLLIMEQFSVVFLFPKDAGQMFKHIFAKMAVFCQLTRFFKVQHLSRKNLKWNPSYGYRKCP